MKNEHGQVILILILVMTVALAIGISVIQRSLSDISTATRVEQSSRAFSAAEAGIEKVLSGGGLTVSFEDNSSNATVTQNLQPAVNTGFGFQDPLECPPGKSGLAKEEVAQVWLADPNSAANPPAEYYKGTNLSVFWGDSSASSDDKAALELTLIYHDGTEYKSRKWFLDQQAAVRNPANNFSKVNCTPVTFASSGIKYQCKYVIGGSGDPDGFLPTGLMLLRARLLYNKTSQPFAVRAETNCQDCSIPPQAQELVSEGFSGQSKRTIQVCQISKVVPFYFDYAVFSAGDINK
ncbi:pilus assembly PilX N-terminal domain-containing protein [Candidatus Daviesbacteria bacterium]|nr:pilus assembly PilX N-terminal domain-containing protein [Candidatus Daviesbacteria bacterium]